MAEQFANDAITALAASIGASDVSLTVLSATSFPTSGNFRIRIDNEILLVTAVSGTTWSVTRAVEAVAGVITATRHLSGAQVTHVLTAASVQLAVAPGTYSADEVTLHLATGVFSINLAYTGQTSLTTLGTIITGVWNGTPVTVPYGGTGGTSTNRYGVVCGGTTSTGPFQNAGTGTMGQVLTSLGTNVLPSWQTPTTYPLTETFGSKLRRLAAEVRKVGTPWDRPQMRAPAPWQPSTAYVAGNVVVNGGHIYTCIVAGTSAATGGPTILTGSGQTDGTNTQWTYWGENQVTTDPYTTPAAWASGTVYSLGNLVVNNNLVYACVGAGTSAGSGGPTGTSNSVADNTATWTYMGVYQTNSLNNICPKLTYSSSAPSSPQNNSYIPGSSGSYSVQQAYPVAGGSSYAIGDTITIATSTGTATTAAVLKVAAVSSGAVTAVTVQTPGVYTYLQYSAATWGQGSTSGSGSGATFDLYFNNPIWMNVYGMNLAYNDGGSDLRAFGYTYQSALNTAATTQHTAFEFYSDSELVCIHTGAWATSGVRLSIDGICYALDAQGSGNTSDVYYNFDFTQAGGKKKRLFRLAIRNSTVLPHIIVNQNSTVWAPDTQDNVTAVCISDSIWAGSSYGPFFPGNSTSLRLGEEMGWKNVFSFTQGGTGYLNAGIGSVFGFRVAQGLTLRPDIWILMGSTNDATTTGLAAAVTSLLTAIRAGSNAPILVFGVWPCNSANVAANEPVVQTGVTNFADPLGLTWFIPIYNDPFFPWVSGSWNNSPAPSGVTNGEALNQSSYINNGDNIHPPDPGTEYLAKRLANAIRQNVLNGKIAGYLQ